LCKIDNAHPKKGISASFGVRGAKNFSKTRSNANLKTLTQFKMKS
jgi:hypothetical protein